MTLKHTIVIEIKFILLTSSPVEQCRGVLLGIIGRGEGGGGCLLVIKIPDSIEDQNCHVFTPVFIHGGLEIMSSLLGLEQEQNLNLNWYSSLSF